MIGQSSALSAKLEHRTGFRVIGLSVIVLSVIVLRVIGLRVISFGV